MDLIKPRRKNEIRSAVERKLVDLLARKGDKKPDKEELQTISLAIKFLAVNAKLDEDLWGKDLDDLTKEQDDELEPKIDS